MSRLASPAAGEPHPVRPLVTVAANPGYSREALTMQEEETKLISFQNVQKNIQPLLFCMYDPIGRLLLRVSPKNVWPVVALASVLYGLVMIGGGSAISIIYSRQSIKFLSLLDSRELPIAIFAFLITAPVVWLFYTWQPRGISSTFHQLHRNDVIGDPRNVALMQGVFEPGKFLGKLYFWLSLVIVAVGLLVWLSAVSFYPINPFSFGESAFWWMINPIYFWVIWIPLVFINLYMVAWIIFRQITATVAFNSLFKVFQIKPKLLHPDGCNGFAPIGDYAIRSALIAVFFGFWLFVFITYPLLFGQPINLKIDTMILFVVYVIAVPSLLLPPVISAHRAMVEAKNTALEDLAGQIRTLLLDTNMEEILSSKDLLLELELRYEIASKEYHTWPFRSLSIKSFGISAVIPIISTAISFLIDLYTRQ